MRIFAITNRELAACDEEYIRQLESIASSGVDAVVLREKQLGSDEYLSLARRFACICYMGGAAPILHSRPDACRSLGIRHLHMPLPLLEAGADTQGLELGVSVHSLEEAQAAAGFNPSYLLAGNIFETGCKPGLAGKGLGLVEAIHNAFPKIPLLAIGGITADNARSVMEAGACGVALMSGFMLSDEPAALTRSLRG